MQIPLAGLFSDFIELFYPNVCLACSEKLLKGEEVLCYACRRELPMREYWTEADNPMAKRFWGRIELQGAAALFKFQKDGDVQQLLHQLKYYGRQDAGEFIGKMIGGLILQPGSVIKDVDIIVPVPLHWKRMRSRGYNQCDPIAKAISETIQVPWTYSALERLQENITQTGKNRFDRWYNVAEIFSVKDPEQLKNKHVLLVDDVMTTGATAEACLQKIAAVEGVRVSFVAAAAVR
jgi:competence protein ComFC